MFTHVLMVISVKLAIYRKSETQLMILVILQTYLILDNVL